MTFLKTIFAKPRFAVWWTFFTCMATIIGAVLFMGGIEFLNESDITGLSWAILSVLVLGSIFFGYRVYLNENLNQGVTSYLAELCTSLGLLGTIIGLIVMISGAFGTLEITNPDSVKTSLLAMSSGIGSALTTTLVGLVSSILLTFQKKLVQIDWT